MKEMNIATNFVDQETFPNSLTRKQSKLISTTPLQTIINYKLLKRGAKIIHYKKGE